MIAIFFLLVMSYSCECYAEHLGILEYVKEYFLPETHPIKVELDQIFSQSNVITSEENMIKAGFVFEQSLPRKVSVFKHSKLEGYLIKAYLDDTYEPREKWEFLVGRVEGALKISRTIHAYGYEKIMKVPRKWIYTLPKLPEKLCLDNESEYEKPCLLIVEDMKILSCAKNALHFSTKMTKSRLRALYAVITENLLLDCVYIRNIPFCEDGKIAFIDTESIHAPREQICYDCLTKNLSREMQLFWKKLILTQSE